MPFRSSLLVPQHPTSVLLLIIVALALALVLLCSISRSTSSCRSPVQLLRCTQGQALKRVLRHDLCHASVMHQSIASVGAAFVETIPGMTPTFIATLWVLVHGDKGLRRLKLSIVSYEAMLMNGKRRTRKKPIIQNACNDLFLKLVATS